MKTTRRLAPLPLLAAALAAGTLLLAGGTAYACKITFDTDPVKVDKDGKGKVTVKVKWEHRKCVLEEDEITFDGKGVKVSPQGKWKKVRPGLFTRVLSLKLSGNKGSVRVWRECRKKGVSEGTVHVRR